MHLDYLLFESSDDEEGACSFDAMASVLAARVPALLREVEAVLAWAHRNFGPPSAAEGEGEWGFELQASDERDSPVEIAYDPRSARIAMPHAGSRVTVAFTVSGTRAFADALRDAFPDRQ